MEEKWESKKNEMEENWERNKMSTQYSSHKEIVKNARSQMKHCCKHKLKTRRTNHIYAYARACINLSQLIPINTEKVVSITLLSDKLRSSASVATIVQIMSL